MDLTKLSDTELIGLRDQLQRELNRLRSTVKNLNNTISNITTDMREYRLKHQIIIDDPMAAPRA